MTQTKQTEQILNTNKKNIGDFGFKAQTFSKENDNKYLILKITINDFLKDLLNSVIVLNSEVDYKFYDGKEYQILKRNLVKEWVINSIYSNQKELLFCSKLLKKGFIELKCLNTEIIEKIINDFRQSFKICVETIFGYNNLNVEVKLKQN